MLEETKEKIKQKAIGRKQSEEAKRKNREKHKGNKFGKGNRGKKYCDRRTTSAMLGHIPHNKGKTKDNYKPLKNSSIKLKGLKRSKETILRMKKSKSEIMKQKLREYAILHPNKVFKDTKIELKVEEELNRRGFVLNIDYFKQVPLCKIAKVDFYLPAYRIVIQTDGCYYHNCLIHNPNDCIARRKKDERQDRVLIFNCFNVYRFWEHEINKSVKTCIDKINF